MEWFCAGAIWLGFGLAAARLNTEKGRSELNGCLAGLLLGPLGLIIVLLLPPNQEVIELRQIESGKMKRCPFCRGAIPTGATVCGRCGRQLAVAPKVAGAPPPLSREEQEVKDAQHLFNSTRQRLAATREDTRLRQLAVGVIGVVLSSAAGYGVGLIWEAYYLPFSRGWLLWVLPSAIVATCGLTATAAVVSWVGKRSTLQLSAIQAEVDQANKRLEDSKRRLEEARRRGADLREREARRVQREESVRSKSLSEFIGQQHIVERVKMAIAAASLRGQALDHILIAGPPGCGRETLARLVAKEMGIEMKITSGDAFDWDLLRETVVSQTSEPEIIFVRRLEQLSQTSAEYLSRAMAHRGLVVTDGTVRLKMFAVIGSTTDADKVPDILRTPFPIALSFTPYEQEALGRFIEQYAWVMEVELDESARDEIAKRARGQLLEAKLLLRQAADYAVVHTGGKVSLDVVAALGGKTSA